MNRNLIDCATPSLIDDILSGKVDKSELDGAFVFSETPQGINYWYGRKNETKPLSKTARTHLTRIANFVRKNGNKL